MRWSLLLSLVAACSPARAPSVPGAPELFEVRSKPLMVSSWTRSVVAETKYSLVDEAGFIVDVVADGADPSECDHCPGHRALAHLLGEARATQGVVVALGPLTESLGKAKVLAHRDISAWWNPANPSKEWAEELSIDLDGDGKADLIREAKGPQLQYRVRRVTGTTERVVAEWHEPYVLDVDDK